MAEIRTNLSKIVGPHKPYNLYIKLFDSQVLPILEYGSDIWYQGKPIQELESVHLAFLKSALGVKRQTSSLCIYGETGRFPLLFRQQDRAIKLFLRLKTSLSTDPINHVFNELELLHKSGHKNWYSKINDLLHSTPCNNLTTGNKRKILADNKGLRYTSFINKWNSDILDAASHPILRTYCQFKSEFKKERYLSININRRYLTAISRFRTSSHCLLIETGRHTIPKTPIQNRICKFCSLNEIDDEIHFLNRCNFHNTERDVLLNTIRNISGDIFENHTHLTLMKFILQSDRPEIIHALGKFLSIGFRKRNPPKPT